MNCPYDNDNRRDNMNLSGDERNANKHHRRSIRLQGYDYSSAGAYFITMCARGRECLFGEIIDGEVCLNDAGRIVHDTWLELPDHYPNVEIDAFVVMPNHVHGVVVIVDSFVHANVDRDVQCDVGAIHELPLRQSPLRQSSIQNRRRMTIPLVVGRFKMASSKRINAWRKTPGIPIWQRNYYEHVIRDENSLECIRAYIADNPARWAYDRENPAAAASDVKEKWEV